MGVIDDSSAARLASAPLAWLTTVRADGQPQSSYVWFHFDGDDLVMFSQPRAGKMRNLRHNPKVSFHLDGDVSSGGGVLTIDATAEIIEAGVAPERTAAFAAKYEDRIAKGSWSTPERFLADFSAAIRIVPSRLRAW